MRKLMIILLLGIGAAVRAQAPDPDTTARHFLIMASIGNLQEAQAGKLAVRKAGHADVRSFGEMMVKDHSGAELCFRFRIHRRHSRSHKSRRYTVAFQTGNAKYC